MSKALTRRTVDDRRLRAVASYLSQLAEGPSRTTMAHCLQRVAVVLGRPHQCPWEKLRGADLDGLKLALQHGSGKRLPRRKPLGSASVNKHLAAVKGVLRACFREGLLGAEAYAHIRDVRSVKGQRVLRGREVPLRERQAMIDACDLTTLRGARDAAIVSLLYGCGIRRAELAGLRLGNYDPSKGTITVLGKGNKERSLDVVGGAAEALDHFIGMRGRAPGPLFGAMTWGRYSRRRKDARGVTGAAVLHIVRQLAARAGVPVLSPHDFRRTCIGDLLEAGVDAATVQKVAGHTKSDTTMQYDRRPAQKRREAVARLVVPFPKMTPFAQSPKEDR